MVSHTSARSSPFTRTASDAVASATASTRAPAPAAVVTASARIAKIIVPGVIRRTIDAVGWRRDRGSMISYGHGLYDADLDGGPRRAPRRSRIRDRRLPLQARRCH